MALNEALCYSTAVPPKKTKQKGAVSAGEDNRISAWNKGESWGLRVISQDEEILRALEGGV